MTNLSEAVIFVATDAQGPVLACEEGLSFWGGVDPETGVIIDAHHPNCSAALAGRVVLMPTSRGSCSGSGVLLQLARNDKAPAALVFRDEEEILTLGATIANLLFEKPVAVLRLPPNDYDALAKAEHAEISGDTLRFDGNSIHVSKPEFDALILSDADQAMLNGQVGQAVQLAMQVLCLVAAAQQAKGLLDVTRAHIDGCILAHDANLVFAEKMHDMGAKTRIPTTINAISVDRENWEQQGVIPDFGRKASRLADAYVNMGAQATFTCAPYLLDDAPAEDEVIGWSESNAVIYANSVLGARTQKHPDYLDLFIAMTGRAPNSGVYLEANRRPSCEIRVTPPDGFDDSFWPMLGWLTGVKSPAGIPVITGLEAASPTSDDLKALCAAFGTTSAAPMLHMRGHTPEGDAPLVPGSQCFDVSAKDVLGVWTEFNSAPEAVDLVAIGSPHASLSECREFARLLEEQVQPVAAKTIITVGRSVLHKALQEGLIDRLKALGVTTIPDLCWCSITTPVFPMKTRVLMTNSGKYAHYAQGLTGCDVRFGSLQDCANASVNGRARPGPPDWLTRE